MSQLGFTFYPKDWWTSDTFYALNPFERYIYLELLFMMYVNDGRVANDRVNVERRLGITIKDEVWTRIVERLVIENGSLTHVSVNKRLRKALSNRQNGKKGGRPKNPNNPNKKPKVNPPFKREIERENKIEDEGEKKPLSPPLHPDLICSIESLKEESLKDQYYFVEHVCRQNRITPQEVTIRLEAFNEHLRSIGELTKTKKDYRLHFQNWLKKQQQSKPIQIRKMREI